IYSQPLVVANVLFQGQTAAKTIAYVVTQNDSLYAIDTTNCTTLPSGQKQLLQTHGNLVAPRIRHMLGVRSEFLIGDNFSCLIAFVRALRTGEYRSHRDAARYSN
ncbi:MAG: hypothetical protein WBQ10_15035, partial [Terriglobales bacterium]